MMKFRFETQKREKPDLYEFEKKDCGYEGRLGKRIEYAAVRLHECTAVECVHGHIAKYGLKDLMK